MLKGICIIADVNMSSKMASFALRLHMNALPALALMVMIFYNLCVQQRCLFCREIHIHGADVPPLRLQVSVAPSQPYRAGICHKKVSGRHPNPIRVNTPSTKTGTKIHEPSRRAYEWKRTGIRPHLRTF